MTFFSKGTFLDLRYRTDNHRCDLADHILQQLRVNADLAAGRNLDSARPLLVADSDFHDVLSCREGYVGWCVAEELSINVDFAPARRRGDVHHCALRGYDGLSLGRCGSRLQSLRRQHSRAQILQLDRLGAVRILKLRVRRVANRESVLAPDAKGRALGPFTLGVCGRPIRRTGVAT
jgi:hypothetical protein